MVTGSQAVKFIGNSLYKDFDIDSEPTYSMYKKVYEQLLRGISDNKAKGLLLIGHKGVGKTALMRIMQKLFMESPAKFKKVNASELKLMIEEYPATEIMSMYGKACTTDLYIDDLSSLTGTSQRYGNYINIISEIIYERNELFINEGIRTHLSSNMSTKLDKTIFPDSVTLSDVYGERIVDRLKEMCDIHIWTGESLRK